jgi:DNA-directed RNA polymerase specialized sigma24 family protein
MGSPNPGGFRRTASVDDSPKATRETSLAIARTKQGDRAAFQFLYVCYSNHVYGYVRSIIRDEHEAEDVTQHVFAKIAERMGRSESSVHGLHHRGRRAFQHELQRNDSIPSTRVATRPAAA